MQNVENMERVRIDGYVVPASMTLEELLKRGLGPAKVVGLHWSNHGKTVEYAASNGVHGIVVPGGNFVAAIVDEDLSGRNTHLVILSPDGSKLGNLENNLRSAGVDIVGRYGWFEPAMSPGPDRFGVVFQTDSAGDFRCDINARDLRVIAVAPTR